MRRIHITGCPRSGTTLLMQQMSACFDNAGHCEHEQSIFDAVPQSEGLYISKQPNDIKHLRHIFHRDSALHILYMVRDPRSVITSKHRGANDQYFCNYRVWQECERAAAKYEGHPRFLRLRYEDLVTEPDGVQVRIQSQFPFLTRRDDFSDFHQVARPSEASEQALGGVRKVDQASLGKWRQHLPWLAYQLRRHPELSAELIRQGYEADTQWLQLLEGVDALEYRCRYSERRQMFKEWEKSIRIYLKSRRYRRRLWRAAHDK
jgi:hypothetical protein